MNKETIVLKYFRTNDKMKDKNDNEWNVINADKK